MSCITKRHLLQGFTLIELLVVISIIGILSGIVINQVASARKKAIDANLNTALSQIATQAADLDNVSAGTVGQGLDETTCLNIFTNENIQKLITYTTEVTGRPVISAFCSKATDDGENYKFTFLTESAVDENKYLCVDHSGRVMSIEKDNRDAIISTFSCAAISDTNVDGGDEGGGDSGGDTGGETNNDIVVQVQFNHSSNELIASFNQAILYSNDFYNPYALSIQIIDVNGNDRTSLISDQSLNYMDGITYEFRYSASGWGDQENNPCYIGDNEQSYDPDLGERNGPYQAIFRDIYGTNSMYALTSLSATIDFRCADAI